MVIEFEYIEDADLVVDMIYKSGSNNNLSDEVLSKLMKCENSGGFRKKGSIKDSKLKYVVLYSTGTHSEWVDSYNKETNEFIYYGDQDKPNKEVDNTRKKGNLVLKRTFEMLNQGNREDIAPFFVFMKQEKRDVKFIGLAVPGSSTKSTEECIVEIETIKPEGKIKNYRAIFTVLNIPMIDHRWIDDLEKNIGYDSQYAPYEWKKWIKEGFVGIKSKEIVEENDCFDNEMDVIDMNQLNYVINNIDNFHFDIKYNPHNHEKRVNKNFKEIQFVKKVKSTKEYVEEYIKKQKIGIIGELIILNHEKEIIKKSKSPELIKKLDNIEW